MSAYAQISGRLGQIPELRFTKSEVPVLNLSIASNRQKKDAHGEKMKIADWFRVTVFGRDAEVIAQFAKKGSALMFNGRLQTELYYDREGQQRTATSIVADSFEFIATQKKSAESDTAESDGTKNRKKSEPSNSSDEDIPF